jgi:hypothetical protein
VCPPQPRHRLDELLDGGGILASQPVDRPDGYRGFAKALDLSGFGPTTRVAQFGGEAVPALDEL